MRWIGSIPAAALIACAPLPSQRAPLVTTGPSLTYEALAEGGVGIAATCSRAATGRQIPADALALELHDHTDLPVTAAPAIAATLGDVRSREVEEKLCSEPPPGDAELAALLSGVQPRFLLLARVERDEVEQRYREEAATVDGGDDREVYTSERVVSGSLRVFDDRLGETVWLARGEARVAETNSVVGPRSEGAFLEQLSLALLSGLILGPFSSTHPEPPTSACAFSRLFRELVESLPRRHPPAWSERVTAALETPLRCDEQQRWRRGQFLWE